MASRPGVLPALPMGVSPMNSDGDASVGYLRRNPTHSGYPGYSERLGQKAPMDMDHPRGEIGDGFRVGLVLTLGVCVRHFFPAIWPHEHSLKRISGPACPDAVSDSSIDIGRSGSNRGCVGPHQIKELSLQSISENRGVGDVERLPRKKRPTRCNNANHSHILHTWYRRGYNSGNRGIVDYRGRESTTRALQRWSA